MIRRTQTHITDTLAVRNVISTLPSNWIVRNLEERDYGIDLKIELFNGETPTGGLALIQIKGTKSEFTDSDIKLSFPTRTLEYAKLFPEPFFIFYTSITSNKTYFVWVQKYIEDQLEVDKSTWINQETNTIYFPNENILGGEEANNKIESIINQFLLRQKLPQFIFHIEWFKLYWPDYGFDQPILEQCIQHFEGIKEFLDEYGCVDDFIGSKLSDYETVLDSLSNLNNCSDTEEKEAIYEKVDKFTSYLDAYKLNLLGNEIKEITAEMCGEKCY